MSKNGLVQADDLEQLGRQIARNLGFAAGSAQADRVLAGQRAIWQTFWKACDADGDDTVTLAEFLAGADAFLQRPDAAAAGARADKALMAALDADGDGQVTLEEYTAFLRPHGATEQDARTAFQHLDRDGNGTLSADELAAALSEYYSADDPAAAGNYFYGGF